MKIFLSVLLLLTITSCATQKINNDNIANQELSFSIKNEINNDIMEAFYSNDSIEIYQIK